MHAVAGELVFQHLDLVVEGDQQATAQVVGAGFSVSPEAGETATLVKLIRVTMLAPVVLSYSVVLRNVPQGEGETGKRPPLLPGFVIAFLILAALNSFGVIPEVAAKAGSEASRWALLAGIAIKLRIFGGSP